MTADGKKFAQKTKLWEIAVQKSTKNGLEPPEFMIFRVCSCFWDGFDGEFRCFSGYGAENGGLNPKY
jgi:hypothetical protein